VRAVFNITWMLGLTMLFSALCLPVVLVAPVRGIRVMAGLWSRLILWGCGVRVEVTGLERLEAGRGHLVMANHTSHFDVVALYAAVPLPIRFVAKRELVLIPIFGLVLFLGAAIVIDRKNRKKAIASVERARRALERGECVLFFPEGTRTDPGVLGPIKKGPLYLATQARASVLPIGIAGSGDVLPRGDWRIRAGTIRLRIGEPFDMAGFPDSAEGRDALADRLSDTLRGLM
jgi:1-acyl-sn-glycerol-3-phosphate acyltransferase